MYHRYERFEQEYFVSSVKITNFAPIFTLYTLAEGIYCNIIPLGF